VRGGLNVPNRGEVLLGGRPLSSLDAAARGEARAHTVGYVFQGANLLPTFTAFENVAFAAHVSQSGDAEGGEDAEDGGRGSGDPAELLQLVGLGAKLDALPSELSGGEAQRVAIARALAQQPALLLCDEPTGQLDSDTSSRVLDLMEALHERLGFALVIATHDSQVASGCERIVTLDDGHVVGDEALEA
jgi:predicted ABC-type transport system involved in lysophospholipase L1 biosynthesis ATPase subunit